MDEKCSGAAGCVEGDENPQEAYETPVSITIQPDKVQPSSSDYEIPRNGTHLFFLDVKYYAIDGDDSYICVHQARMHDK